MRESYCKIIGHSREGEYSGQTRFLTMPENLKGGTAVFERLDSL